MGDAIEDDLPSVAIGEVIGEKYRVEGLIGSGAMGSVYRAHRLGLGAKVAIKVLRPERLDDASAERRFYLEAKSTSRLQSPHAVRMFEIDRLASGLPYIVMEYLDGEDLAAIVNKRGELPKADAVRYIIDACDAVGEAHRLSIIHRDVKPANLFLTVGGELKVLDFGLAKDLPQLVPDGGSESTKTNFLLGSPHYMSPEQLRSAKDVDARADIWSLGATLFTLLCGAPPFAGQNLYVLISLILEGEAPSLRERVPSVPEELDEVVRRCLRRDRNDRYASCDALRSALQAVLDNLPPEGVRSRRVQTRRDELSATMDAPVPMVRDSVIHVRSNDGVVDLADPIDDVDPTALVDSPFPTAPESAPLALPRLYDDDPPSVRGEAAGTQLMPQTIDRLLAKAPGGVPRVYDDDEDLMPDVTKMMADSPYRPPSAGAIRVDAGPPVLAPAPPELVAPAGPARPSPLPLGAIVMLVGATVLFVAALVAYLAVP